MDANKLKEIIARHALWLEDRGKGARADLCEANLRGANLRGADLRWANLCEADLCEADLREANLCEANLCEASLYGANLYGANLRGADLRWANLRDANLLVIQCGPYTAYVQPNHTRIGCQYHTNSQWRRFSRKALERLDADAVATWDQFAPVLFAAMDSLKASK